MDDSSIATATRPPRKRIRKATNTLRKEEIEALEREIQELQSLRERLRSQHAAQSQDSSNCIDRRQQEDEERRQRERDSELDRLTQVLQHTQLSFTGLRSLVSAYFIQQPIPFASIRLGTDRDERRATLEALRPARLQAARRFILERRRFLDPTQPHVAIERHQNAAGDPCHQQFDITPFPGTTVQSLLRAATEYATNMELHLSEQLGTVAIREDDDASEPWNAASSQRRVVSTTPVGLCVEGNFVYFRELFPAGSTDDLPEEHALLAAQFVESDALYPYVPASRLRFDIEGNVLISRAPGDGVVTFTRWASIRLHRGPSGAVPAELTTAIRDGLQQWADVMLRAIRERVELQATTTTTTTTTTSSSSNT